MTLVVGVSMRMFPALDINMRDGECTGELPPAGCVLVMQLEQGGGVGGGAG
jgi:hypothetical protein